MGFVDRRWESAPLYGRAREILHIEPMAPRFLGEALGIGDAADVVRRYAVFGGVPRYWELMAAHEGLWGAVEALVLDPLGVLHEEPARLLHDDLSEPARAASILALIGQGCGRLSEVAGRLGQPATSMTRPVARLTSLGLVRRETPFGIPARDSKRSVYRIADPLLAFWFRFVEPNRSRLAAGERGAVAAEVRRAFPTHLGQAWEALVRWRLARAPLGDERWTKVARWWGRGTDGRALELDGVAESAEEPERALVVEAKLQVSSREVSGLLAALLDKAARCPALAGRRCTAQLWVLEPGQKALSKSRALGPAAVLDAE